jgi:hypothetical protein
MGQTVESFLNGFWWRGRGEKILLVQNSFTRLSLTALLVKVSSFFVPIQVNYSQGSSLSHQLLTIHSIIHSGIKKIIITVYNFP